MRLTPFFSVCIPVYNGAGKIVNALTSLEHQTFSNFEVIIVDDKSTDGTFEKVKIHLQKSNLKYLLHRNESNLGMVKNWNKTIELAQGEYIAFLHQDDEYISSHLEEAHKVLSKYDNIGIYAVGNQRQQRPIIGLIEPKGYFQYIYKMENVSPPSETIFKRKYRDREYFYNKDYIYCPEVELYLEMANDRLKAYHSDVKTVIRGTDKNSVTGKVTYTWTYFGDKFKIIDKYKNHKYINKEIYLEALDFQINNAFMTYIHAKMRKVGKPDEIFQGIKVVLQKEFPFKHHKMVFLKICTDGLIKYKLIHILRKARLHKATFFILNLRTERKGISAKKQIFL